MKNFFRTCVISISVYFVSTQQCAPSSVAGSGVSLQGFTNFSAFYGNTWNGQFCPTGFGLTGSNSKLQIGGNYDISGNLSVINNSNLNFSGDVSIECCSNITVSNLVSGTADSSIDIGSYNIIDFMTELSLTNAGSFSTLEDCRIKFDNFSAYKNLITDGSTITLGNHANMYIRDSFKLIRSLIVIEGNKVSASEKQNLFIDGRLTMTDSTIIIGEMAYFHETGTHTYIKLDVHLNAGSSLVLFGTFTKASTNRITVTLGMNSNLTIAGIAGTCTITNDIHVPDGRDYGIADVARSLACT